MIGVGATATMQCDKMSVVGRKLKMYCFAAAAHHRYLTKKQHRTCAVVCAFGFDASQIVL